MHYYVEIEVVSFAFDLAMFFFLNAIRKGTNFFRATYMRFLVVVTVSCAAEAALGIMLNYGAAHPGSAVPITAGYAVAESMEMLTAFFLVYYFIDMADMLEAYKKVIRVLSAGLALYLLLQIINLFTGLHLSVNSSGEIITGPLFMLMVYVFPFGYMLCGLGMFFVMRSRYSLVEKLTLLGAAIISILGAAVQGLVLTNYMITNFFISLGAFVLFFTLETPPFRQLASRLHELEEANDQVEKERERALEADRSMNEFLANMSHEIRTPLTAIMGYDEVIINDAEEEDVREYAYDIHTAGELLLHTIGDILDFSKIESGEFDLNEDEYHLSRVLDNLDNMMREKVRDKRLEYKTDIDDNLPDLLFGDEARVNQIILNLLNNAVKYTEKGWLKLKIDAENEPDNKTIRIRAEVSDSGIGIREEDMPDIFSAFARFDLEHNKQVEGTGLGLAITARLLKMMNGTIDVKSEYGKGSVFTVVIPQKIAGEQTIEEYRESDAAAAHSALKTLLAPDAKMLVVDDNSTNRMVVGELLRGTLIDMDMAESGEECLKKVREKAYDIILLDQMMPNLSGSETLKILKKMPENKSADAHVAAFTANAIAGTREQLLSEGFDDYVSKPVTGEALTNMLLRHLPKAKVLLPGAEGYGEALELKEKRRKEEHSKSSEKQLLEELEGIDLAAGLTFCGSRDVLLSAVKDFYNTIEPQAERIEYYLNENDIPNYTIKVHALKSAARFIGATRLSEDAAFLEQQGNENNVDVIKEKTPELLEDYRAYLTYLKKIDPAADGEEDTRPEISTDELAEAYEALRQFADEFDFDGVDSVMESLAEYSIPDNEKERFKQISQAVTNVSREELLKLLQQPGS